MISPFTIIANKSVLTVSPISKIIKITISAFNFEVLLLKENSVTF